MKKEIELYGLYVAILLIENRLKAEIHCTRIIDDPRMMMLRLYFDANNFD